MTQDIAVRLTVAESPTGIRLQGTFVTNDRRALAELTPRGLAEVVESLRRQVVQAHANAVKAQAKR